MYCMHVFELLGYMSLVDKWLCLQESLGQFVPLPMSTVTSVHDRKFAHCRGVGWA